MLLIAISDSVASALLGAVVGLVGGAAANWALQQARFRRADLDATRERAGIAHALRAELIEAITQVNFGLEHQVMSTATRFRVPAWEAFGYRLVPHLAKEPQKKLVDVYAKLRLTNGILEGVPPEKKEITLRPGIDELADGLTEIRELIRSVALSLDAVIATCDDDQRRLEERWLRSAWQRLPGVRKRP